MISLLCLLLLVLSLQTLLAVVKHAKLEKIELSATIHAPFNQFEPIHLTLGRTIAPRERESCKHGVFVSLNAGQKGLEFGQTALCYVFEPWLKLLTCPFAQHLEKKARCQ